MKNFFLLFFVVISLITKNTLAQGTDCSTASPFCTSAGVATFPAQQNTVAPVGPNYGCLYTQPNPAWYYLQVSTAGPLTLNMTNSANVDIDFIIWGPFTSDSAACSSGLTGTAVDCSYSATSNETGVIPSTVIGEVYVLLITNYSNQPTTISLQQTAGTGTTNCNIVCAMTALTASPGSCISPSNLFDLSGTLAYNAPPTTGTLTISNSCSSVTQVFNAPFNPDSVNYTLAGLPSDGASCTVTAVFSDDPTCTITQTFTCPAPCFVNCPINVDSALTCAGVPVTLTASGATSYLWSTGDTTASILVSGVAATYTVIGQTGSCSDTAISVVTTYSPPTVSFTADTLSGCESLLVNFTADTVGNAGATYTWMLGEGAIEQGVNPSHTYKTPGCYTVTMKASYREGCYSTDSITCMITVFDQPKADFTTASAELELVAPTAYFTNTSTSVLPATEWLWSFGDSTTSTLQNPEHTFADAGTYPVKLYVTNPHGCSDSMSSVVIVKDVSTMYIPNSFTPNNNGNNDLFRVSSFGISNEGFELLIFDRWGNQVFKTNDLKEGWNGGKNNTGEILPDSYAYQVVYRELTGQIRVLFGHVLLMR